ncbi:hypothetical_protein [Leishmania major strain Friedlin]|nr:hypothetical_protein [Leishmania major strain Friedlin]
MDSARALEGRRTALFFVDTQTTITDGHVLHQLIDFADSLGLVLPVWMSYNLSLKSGLCLRRGTAPVNVWHRFCGKSFFAAPAAHTFHIIDRSALRNADPSVVCDFILTQMDAPMLKWVVACPSMSPRFHSTLMQPDKRMLWVPTELRSIVPVYRDRHVTFPPFATFVHVEQLRPDKKIAQLMSMLYSTPRCP